MFVNYFKIAIRNLLRYKVFSIINIMGLSIGMAVFILISFFVYSELNHDRMHANHDRIYMLGAHDNNDVTMRMPAPLAPLIADNIPEIEETVLLNLYVSFLNVFKYNGRIIKNKNVILSSKSLFDIFPFSVVQGDLEKALDDPNSMVMAESFSRKMFGDDNPLGKTIRINGSKDYTVTAVIEDIPENSQLQAEVIIPISSWYSEESLQGMDNWIYVIYVLGAAGMDADKVGDKISALVKENFEQESDCDFELTPMLDCYFGEDCPWSPVQKGSLQQIYIMSMVALFILIIACINYINLSTARASVRTREIGIRKVVGGSRWNLILQFLCESVILSMIATFLAVILIELLVMNFDNLTTKSISDMQLFHPPVFLLVLVGSAVVGILAGAYPAFYLSSLKPLEIMKGGKAIKGKGGSFFRKLLVVTQFSISIVLIVSTLTVMNQLDFIKTSDLGFDKDQVVYMRIDGIRQKYKTFKQELLRNPNIQRVTLSSGPVGNLGMQQGYFYEIDKEIKNISMMSQPVNFGYLETMGLELVAGRDFSEEYSTDKEEGYIINETAAKMLGYESAVGKHLRVWDREAGKGKIIGVVKDFNFQPFRSKIQPLALLIRPNWCRYINIRISTDNLQPTIADIRRKWHQISPEFPFEYEFADQLFARMYRSEEKMGGMFLSFSILAIFIACLGLFGLSSFMTEQRKKEIGIRKVMGSSVGNIVVLITSEFVKWVIVASFIAWPLAWYGMDIWLQTFAYRIEIGWLVFIISGMIALMIAFLTVGLQVFNAARANPVKSLKCE